MPLTRDAVAIWKALNGIICVYKPMDANIYKVKNAIIGNICRDMCQLDCRPPTRHIFIEPRNSSSEEITAETQLSVRVAPSFADLVNVVGPRYLPKDVKCNWATFLGENTSGVLVLGINGGVRTSYSFGEERALRTLQVKARLGRSTDSGWAERGRVVTKAKYGHVPREALDRILATTQAAHQRQAFEYAGLDPQSQAAYEMAKQGIVRPAGKSGPLLYGVRCIDFQPPDFTLEIQSINENETYIVDLVSEIGRRVRSAAACVSIRCTQHGPFSVEHALARSEWRLDRIVANMQTCATLLGDKRKRQIAAA